MTTISLDAYRLRRRALAEIEAARACVDTGELWPALDHAAHGGALVMRYLWRMWRGR